MSEDSTCKVKVQPPPCPPREPAPPCPDESKEEDIKENECKEIWSPGFDARFPNQNQTRRCWQNYLDYYRCQKKFGEDHEPCEYFKKTFQHICPQFWIEKWDDQKDGGVFPIPKWA